MTLGRKAKEGQDKQEASVSVLCLLCAAMRPVLAASVVLVLLVFAGASGVEHDVTDADRARLGVPQSTTAIAKTRRVEQRRRAIRRTCPKKSLMHKVNHRNVCTCGATSECAGPRCSHATVVDPDTGFSRRAAVFPPDCTECICYDQKKRPPPPLPPLSRARFSRELHRPLIVWTDSDTASSRRPTCLTPPVCVHQGELHFPPLTSSQVSALRQCGVDVNTSLPALSSAALSTAPVVDLTNTTLLGWKRARNWHFPHFAVDVLWLLDAYDLLYEYGGTAAPTHSPSSSSSTSSALHTPHRIMHCLRRGSTTTKPPPSSASSTPDGDCAHVHLHNMSLLVDVELSDVWSAEFMHLLSRRFLRFQTLTHRWRPNALYCFNGLLSSNTPFHRLPPTTLDAKTGFFADHNIDRAPISLASLKSASSPAAMRVVIVNRPASSGRSILGVDAIAGAVRATLAALNISHEVIVEEHLETKSLSAQIALFNAATAVISAHGAANTNWLFLRPNALAIEVFPFAYHPRQYSTIARLIGAKYKPIQTQPDTTRFFACMHHSSPEVLVNETNAIMDAWLEAEREYWRSGEETINFLAKHNAFPHHPKVRPCVREQNLHVSAEPIANTIAAFVKNL
ncbi:hypothetical protein PTSG_12822, partial [Salpingoeca rosetta]